MSKLSLVLITHNAASQLHACLASAQSLVDEIVVVDSGSVDDTLIIAAMFSAKITHQSFLGFGPQKRLAVSLASHDWVLCLDADERLTPDLADAIQSALASPAFGAYRIARRNRFMGRYLRHGEGYPDWNIRLFDRQRAAWSEHAVHENVQSDYPVGSLAGDLLHDSADSLASYLNKQNRYTDMQASKLFADGKRASAAKMVGSPIARFVRFYVLKQGWRDGLPGLAHIAIGSFFAFVKYAKLYELWRTHNDRAK